MLKLKLLTRLYQKLADLPDIVVSADSRWRNFSLILSSSVFLVRRFI
jgi:hypothetical protein